MSWRFRVERAGKYQIRLRYASEETANGGELICIVDDDTIFPLKIRDTGGFESWKSLNVGEIDLGSGTHNLTVQGRSTGGDKRFSIEKVTLTSAESQRQ